MMGTIALKVISSLLLFNYPEVHQGDNFCKPPSYNQITKQFNEHIPPNSNIKKYDIKFKEIPPPFPIGINKLTLRYEIQKGK